MARKRRRTEEVRRTNRAGLTALSLLLTKKLAPAEEDGGGANANLAFSPASIYAALALLAAGARGGTLQELVDALGGDTRDDAAAFARRVAEGALADRSRSGGPAVAFACGAWHDAAWALRPGFLDAAAEAYNAEARAVGFSNEVNEEGSKASMVSTGSYMLCGASAVMDQPETVDFVADHPFVFFVIEEVSRAIVFVGRVLDPSI